MLFGLWPALRASGVDPAGALRPGSRGMTAGGGTMRSREWLVGIEAGLSTMLLIGAVLLGLSFLRVTQVEAGYRTDHILSADVNLPRTRYASNESRALFHQRALEKLAAIPGVESTGLVSSLPLRAQMWGDMISRVGDTRPMAERPVADFRFASEGYFRTMGVALREGRFIEATDRSRPVVVVSESAAGAAWPGESPVGKQIVNGFRKEGVTIEVVGVVADVRTESLEKQATSMVYVPYWDGKLWQGSVWGNETYVLRTNQDPAAVVNAMRRTMREMDGELPLSNVFTMEQVVADSVGPRRFQTLLAGVFAGAALLLASLGIYSVISYTVLRRTNEIGIRMALGARAGQVMALVLRQGIRPVLFGMAAGVVAALWAGELMRNFLFGTEARDPWVIVGVAGVLLLVAGAACWVPARRASRVDPMTALRTE